MPILTVEMTNRTISVSAPSIVAHAVGALLFLGVAGILLYAIVLGENYTQSWGYANVPDGYQLPTFALSILASTGFGLFAARLLRPRTRLAPASRVLAALALAATLSAGANLLILIGTSPEAYYSGRALFLSGAALSLFVAVALLALLGRVPGEHLRPDS